MDISICNGKLTQMAVTKALNYLLIYYLELYIIKHTPSKFSTLRAQFRADVLKGVTPKWCLELHGKVNRKLMKMQITRKKFLESLTSTIHSPRSESTRTSIVHTHTHAHTCVHTRARPSTCTQKKISEVWVRKSERCELMLYFRNLPYWKGSSQALRDSAINREVTIFLFEDSWHIMLCHFQAYNIVIQWVCTLCYTHHKCSYICHCTLQVTIYLVLTMCQVSQSVLYNRYLIWFFQELYLARHNIFILQVKKNPEL